MSRGKLLGIGLILLAIIALVGGYLFFVSTGGKGLSRVTWHYFIKDLPDKKYSWRDFTDRGPSEGISGFYAYGDEGGFSMWTLSGLKTFSHVEGASVYVHEDVCAAVRQLVDNPDGQTQPVMASKEVTQDIGFWQTFVKQENLVTVVRLDKPDYHNGIGQVWSYSGIYKELNKLDKDSCQ